MSSQTSFFTFYRDPVQDNLYRIDIHDLVNTFVLPTEISSESSEQTFFDQFDFTSLATGLPKGGLPGDLLIKTGSGDYEAQWLSITGDVQIDSSGNTTVFNEKGPEFTYSSGRLVRIDYDSGNYKLLGYDQGGLLSSVTYHKVTAGKVITKTFNYVNGVLVSIDQTEV